MNIFDLSASISVDFSNYLDGIKNAVERGKRLADGLENTVNAAEDLGKSMDEVGKEISDVVDDIQKVTDELADTEKQEDETGKKTDKLGESMDGLGKSADGLEDSIDDTKDSVDGLGETADKAAKRTNPLLEKITALRNRLNMAKEEVSTAKERVEKLTEAFNKSAMETGVTSDETKRLANELDKAEHELKDAEGAAKDAADELKKAGRNTKDSGEEAEKAGKRFEKFRDGLDKAADGLKKVADVAGRAIEAVAKVGVAAVGAATTGLVALTKQGLDAYGTYEQLLGGIEAAFEGNQKAINTVMETGKDAWKTLTMSTNEYYEAFMGAYPLIKAGMADQNEAIETTNRLMQLEADLANTFGYTAENAANAINWALKGTYSYLDNLNIGIKGTKEGFLEAANASGILGREIESVDELSTDEIVSVLEHYADAYGVLGRTGEEAAKTLEGSGKALKAAWENLLTGFGREDVDLAELSENLMTSVDAVASNIAPRIGQIFEGISRTLPVLIPKMYETAKKLISENSDSFLSGISAILTSGGKVVENVLNDVVSMLPDQLPGLLDKIGDTITTGLRKATRSLSKIGDTLGNVIGIVADGLIDNLPAVLEAFNGFFGRLLDQLPKLIDVDKLQKVAEILIDGLIGTFTTLADRIPAAIDFVADVFGRLVEVLSDPKIIKAAMDVVPKIADALISHVDDIINVGTKFIQSLIGGITSEDGSLMDAAIDVIMSLVDAFTDNLDDILLAAQTLITALLGELTKPDTLEKIISAGTTILAKLVEGVFKIGGSFLGFTEELGAEIGNGIAEYDWGAFGLAIINGIADGLLKVDAISDAVDGLSECWAIGYIDIENFLNDADAKFSDFADSFAVGADDISTKATEFLTGLGEAWNTGWNDIKDFGAKIYNGFTNFCNKWREFWVNIAATLQNKVAEFKQKLQAIPDKFTELVRDARTWGRDMIQNFIDGITAKWNALTSKARGAAQVVADYLHFSVPKRGPLSDFDKSAPDMMQLFANGISQNASLLDKAFNDALGFAENIPTPEMEMPEVERPIYRTADLSEEHATAYAPSNAQNAAEGGGRDRGVVYSQNALNAAIELLGGILSEIKKGHTIVTDVNAINSDLGFIREAEERSVLA